MAAVASASLSVAGVPSLRIEARSARPTARIQNAGLRMNNKLDAQKSSTFESLTKDCVSASRTTCTVDAFPVIAASTATLLGLGRFVFLPYHRRSLKAAGQPVQNGVTHSAAGDGRAIEVTGLLKTNDPEGFTIIDVLAWGALGHAVAFFVLAVVNNDYNPTF